MSSRAASCPSCGGEVLFRAGSSLVSVCPHCRAAVARKGANLETLGTVAELVPTSSPFRLGLEGKPKKGYRPFRIAGRLQLSTGEGTWDEWYVSFDDGRYGWLAEAQGAFYLLKQMPAPAVPEYESLAPGNRLDLTPYGLFTVAERRGATYVSAEGELPFAAPPGSVFQYADLKGDDGGFATLDYGDDPGLDAFFAGQRVELAELGIPGLTKWEERKVAARAASLNCPSCGGPLTLKDPAATVRIACVYCGALLGGRDGEAGGKFEVLEKLGKQDFNPFLPLGGSGTLLGHPYVILGALRKSCTVEGVTYFWREYLLKETKTEAYHWLVESNGHYSLVTPLDAPVELGPRFAEVNEKRYRHFQTTSARVNAVLGEFYWAVSVGETTDVMDYVAPPRILSQEKTENEVTWSEGVYVPKEDVEKGFALKTPLPQPEGVASNQPWPYADEYPLFKGAVFTMMVAATVLFLFFNIRAARKVVYEARHELSGAPRDEQVVLSEPFEIDRTGNVEARLEAPSDNTWVTVGASLIDQVSGEARSFALTSDYYHGVDGGESWSEGSRSRTVYVSHVPAGRYVLRLEPEYEVGKAPPSYTFRLRSGVPRLSRFIMVLFFLWLGQLVMLVSKLRFEGRRWAESDYGPSVTSGGSSSSDDDD